MVPKLSVAAAVAALFISFGGSAAADTTATNAAIADAGRPAEDTARDAARKPAAMVEFAGMKPGDSVLELLPGGGYFTRIFSKVVGASGKLYAAVPDPKSSDAEPAAAAIAAQPGYANVSVVPIAPLPALPPLDIIWTSWNYHDLHLSRVHADMASVDKGFYAALKPGGVVIIMLWLAIS